MAGVGWCRLDPDIGAALPPVLGASAGASPQASTPAPVLATQLLPGCWDRLGELKRISSFAQRGTDRSSRVDRARGAFCPFPELPV